ncbi:oxidoreductase,Oxoglutarate/iron-dependent oxygenase family [Pseudohyphozyma bogoriensis]|nr:oxidoreductase,Oxoglutarate/iron-dependent oxygenase family [Pseudohyphozyma bogoriensis]
MSPPPEHDSFPTLSYALAVSDPPTFIAQLQQALLTKGFFYLADIDAVEPDWNEQWDEAFRVSQEFFALSLDDKMAIKQANSRHFRGYSALGVEITAGKSPDSDPIVPYPPSPSEPIEWSLYGPNQYPSQLPSFEPAIKTYRSTCERISEVLVERMAESLTPHKELFKSLFTPEDETKPCFSRMKVVQYPPVKPGDPGLGVGAHKDGGGITLLAQDNTGGLQVQRWDGEWVGVEPKPYALVINVGQVIERMSAGTYAATTHRVLPTLSPSPRLSIPFFFCPPLPTLLTPLLPSQLHPTLQTAKDSRTEISEVKKADLHEEVFGRAAWRGMTRSHGEVWDKFYGRDVDSLGGPEFVVPLHESS